MNEEIETDDVIIEEEFDDPTGYVAELESMKSFKDMAQARGDEVVKEAEVEAEVEDEIEVEEVTKAPAPFLTLADGTALTKEEAIAGYMRHIDYTQKGMKTAETAKELEQYKGFITAMKDPEHGQELVDMVIDFIRNKRDASTPAPAQPQPMQIPERYKDDEWVKQQVEFNNMVVARLAKAEGGVGAIKQEKVQSEEQAVAHQEYEQRLQKSYKWLGEQTQSPPSAEDFVNKMRQHFESKGMTPKQYNAMILGPDSDYLRAQVAEVFRADIGNVPKDKVNSKRETRQPKGATKRALKATGKPPSPASTKIPRLPDGSLDMEKFMAENPVWNEDKRG